MKISVIYVVSSNFDACPRVIIIMCLYVAYFWASQLTGNTRKSDQSDDSVTWVVLSILFIMTRLIIGFKAVYRYYKYRYYKLSSDVGVSIEYCMTLHQVV